MTGARIAELPRRGVVKVSGPDARTLLNDLVTCELGRAEANGAAYGALLTPQGKILFDFIVFATPEGWLFDIRRDLAEAFIKRLTLYRLRAKVEFADLSDDRIVVATWGGDAAPLVDGPVARDPRLASLGFRAIVPAGADMAADHDEGTEPDYDAHRIALGIPEGGIDFAFGETFPHDAALDQLAGVDFDKGCYVGQEVVSRMEHRGTARRRIVMVRGDGLPPAGAAVTAGGRELGALGSSAGSSGLAVVRLDRAKAAIDAGQSIVAAEATISLTLPDWARFGWPRSEK
jgi:tRNA-modifying protein YgfZ